MTNYEKLKAMTPEEIPRIMHDKAYDFCSHCEYNNTDKCASIDVETCINNYLKWLNQEATE